MSDIAAMRFVLVLIVAILLATTGPAQTISTPQNPQFEAMLSPQELEVGERGTLVITPPADLDIASMQGRLSGLRIGEFEPQPDGSFAATVHALRPGAYGLEEMEVQARLTQGGSITAPLSPLSFTVPDPEQTQEQEDYSGLFAASRTLWPYLLAGAIASVLLVAVLILLVWFIRRWMKARAQQAALPTPLPSPIDEAFALFEPLENLEEYHTRGTKAHYVALSMILRRYMERQWQDPAMEMSEDEVSELLRSDYAHRPGVSDLLKVFSTASLAKFARMEVSIDDVRHHMRATRAFLTSERDRLRAAAMARQAADQQRTQRPAQRHASGKKEAA